MHLTARVHFVLTAPLIILGLVSIGLFIVVLVDMVRRPTWQWRQAGSNKTMWILLEVMLFVLFGFLSIVSGIVYLAAARPKLLAAERAGDMTNRYGGSGYGGSGYGSGYGGSGYGSGYGGSWSGGYHSGSAGERGGPPPSGAPGPSVGAPPVTQVPPSWQPDPSRRHELRYWDGMGWTEHVADQGRQSTDPLEEPEVR